MLEIIIEWRLTTPSLGRTVHRTAKDTSIGSFLCGLFPGQNWEEIMIVYNGKAVAPTDVLTDSGTLVLIPMLCGG